MTLLILKHFSTNLIKYRYKEGKGKPVTVAEFILAFISARVIDRLEGG